MYIYATSKTVCCYRYGLIKVFSSIDIFFRRLRQYEESEKFTKIQPHFLAV